MEHYMWKIVISVLLLALLTSCTSVKSMSGKEQQTINSSDKPVENTGESSSELISDTNEITEDTVTETTSEITETLSEASESTETLSETVEILDTSSEAAEISNQITNKKTDKKTDSMSLEYYLSQASKIQSIYSDILLHPDVYQEYYSISENIPSDEDMGVGIDIDGTEPYYFALQDINTDGTDELLLGYGEGLIQTPRVLLNILQYDEKTDSVIDIDGDRTYPIMDNLIFYTSGYFSTQNEVSDLYTECWRLDDEPDHYWYGWERGGEFYDSDGEKMQLEDYYAMVGPLETSFSLSWKKVSSKNIRKEIFQKD